LAANRRLLEVEKVTHDCILAEETFRRINQPRMACSIPSFGSAIEVNGQRASALRFAEPKVQMLWHALLLFRLQPQGFRNADLRNHMAALSGIAPEHIHQGAMTYQLRRLRLHE
jgi:hypothetical protein